VRGNKLEVYDLSPLKILWDFGVVCLNLPAITLVGFGTFDVKDRAERTGRNPQTGQEITIAAAKVPSFKPGKALKDAVNG
jgi:hypothetical protein